MRVKLNAIALLAPPFILLIGVEKVHIARKLFAKAEGGGSLCLVFCPVELGLDHKILRTPWICEVDIFQIQCLKAVLATCVIMKANTKRSDKSDRSRDKQSIATLSFCIINLCS